MMSASSAKEQERLDLLYQLNILDTLPEKAYNNIVYLASQATKCPIALISLVDKDRVWFKARFGALLSQSAKEHALCTNVIEEETGMLVINDLHTDPRFSDHPLVELAPHIRFYAGTALITSEGIPLGTLCVVDRDPRELGFDQFVALETLASLVVSLLEMRLSLQLLQQSQEKSLPTASHSEDKSSEENSSLDPETGLMKRHAFELTLERELQLVKRVNNRFVLVILELELSDFEEEDQQELTQLSAELLSSQLRNRDFLCRFGDNRFACILSGAQEETGLFVAQRILTTFEMTFPHLPQLRLHIGYSEARQDTVFSLLQQVEQALSKAKQQDHNAVVSAASLSL